MLKSKRNLPHLGPTAFLETKHATPNGGAFGYLTTFVVGSNPVEIYCL